MRGGPLAARPSRLCGWASSLEEPLHELLRNLGCEFEDRLGHSRLPLGGCDCGKRTCKKAWLPGAVGRCCYECWQLSKRLEVGAPAILRYFDLSLRAADLDPGRELKVRVIGSGRRRRQRVDYVWHGCEGSGVDIALMSESAPEGEPRLCVVLGRRQFAELPQKSGNVRSSSISVFELCPPMTVKTEHCAAFLWRPTFW